MIESRIDGSKNIFYLLVLILNPTACYRPSKALRYVTYESISVLTNVYSSAH